MSVCHSLGIKEIFKTELYDNHDGEANAPLLHIASISLPSVVHLVISQCKSIKDIQRFLKFTDSLLNIGFISLLRMNIVFKTS